MATRGGSDDVVVVVGKAGDGGRVVDGMSIELIFDSTASVLSDSASISSTGGSGGVDSVAGSSDS